MTGVGRWPHSAPNQQVLHGAQALGDGVRVRDGGHRLLDHRVEGPAQLRIVQVPGR